MVIEKLVEVVGVLPFAGRVRFNDVGVVVDECCDSAVSFLCVVDQLRLWHFGLDVFGPDTGARLMR